MLTARTEPQALKARQVRTDLTVFRVPTALRELTAMALLAEVTTRQLE